MFEPFSRLGHPPSYASKCSELLANDDPLSMNSTLSRIALGIAGLSCIATAICSSLLYMSHLATTGLSTEISDSTTTMERRLEIAEGLDNATVLQSGLANAIWWLSLVAIMLVAVVSLWGFRSRSPNVDSA